MKFVIIIEKGDTNYGAYAPDIPGCIGLGQTPDEARQDLLSGLRGHLQLMAEDGDPMPQPISTVDYLDVDLPAKVGGPR